MVQTGRKTAAERRRLRDCSKWRRRVRAPSRFTSLMFYPCQLWIRYSIGLRIRFCLLYWRGHIFRGKTRGKNREARLHEGYLKFCGVPSSPRVQCQRLPRSAQILIRRLSRASRSEVEDVQWITVECSSSKGLFFVAHDCALPIVNNSGRVNKITHRARVILTRARLTYWSNKSSNCRLLFLCHVVVI